jgi:hypothetical protein
MGSFGIYLQRLSIQNILYLIVCVRAALLAGLTAKFARLSNFLSILLHV